VPVCGNCGRHHATVGEVKECYARSSERGAAEAHGRRQARADGATEMTASLLRAGMTPSEHALWRRLRPRFEGERFDAQIPILGYVVDFYCRRLRLAVEVDGGWHRGRQRLDRLREDALRANHVLVVRVSSKLVTDDVEAALEVLRSAVRARARQLRRPPPGPVAPLVRTECRHGHDSLLCDRCRLVDQALRQREQGADRDQEDRPPRPRPSPAGRFSSTPGLVNRPPEAPGTVSRQGF